MIDKFLCVVSHFISKKEVTSFEIEAFSMWAAKEIARAKYNQQVQFGSLKTMRDVTVTVEVVKL